AHPDVFYVYEPLLYLWDYYVPRKDRSFELRFRTKSFWRKTKTFIPPPLDFLDFMFHCNISKYNTEFLTNVHHSQDFAGCLQGRSRSNIVNMTEDCIADVRNRCQIASVVLQKVVRLSMAEVDIYLQREPALKIIHLVRDPRGILLSRMNFNNKQFGEMHKNFTSFCRRIHEDIVISREIAHKHLGKILTVRYEDLAQEPLQTTELMYKFVGLTMLPSVRDYVHRVTQHEAVQVNGKTAAKQTSRQDPFLTANRWRLELPFSLVQQVGESCRDVLTSMGYLTFSREDQLRDITLPARLQNYGYGLMTA
ncbi:carbohydrate sulfotransferase 6, partial [Biomphalaria glabrata]